MIDYLGDYRITAASSAMESAQGQVTGKKRALPRTVQEKIEVARALKLEGNDFFKAGDYKNAVKRYKRIFLYMNGLHDKNSKVKGFFDMMGASAMWDNSEGKTAFSSSSEEDASNGSQSRTRANDEEGLEIESLKIDANNNIAMSYLKMEDPEKALKHTDDVLSTDPDNTKAIFRKGKALTALGRSEAALHLYRAALENSKHDDKSKVQLKKDMVAVEKLVRAGDKEARAKEKQLFGGKFL